MLVIALTGFATPAGAQTVSGSWPHYAVINLGTLGGSNSNGYGSVTDRGWVSGDSSLSGDKTEHAFVWRDGVITDLGTLGGPNSSTGFPQKNDSGLIVGTAQGPRIDPLKEYWGAGLGCPKATPCEGYKHLEFGFRWENGVMTALPTLGGNNSVAFGDNNLGQVAGAAETDTKDKKRCVPPQVLDVKAVVWGPRGEVQQQLPAFPGDVLAAAVGINDNGGREARSNNNCPRFPATSSRRLSGSMTTATWWACRGGVLSPMNKISPPRPVTPCFGETAQSSICAALEA
jgi:probable HAF family extracellular repeat protein